MNHVSAASPYGRTQVCSKIDYVGVIQLNAEMQPTEKATNC
jgi:hypothetical protein